MYRYALNTPHSPFGVNTLWNLTFFFVMCWGWDIMTCIYVCMYVCMYVSCYVNIHITQAPDVVLMTLASKPPGSPIYSIFTTRKQCVSLSTHPIRCVLTAVRQCKWVIKAMWTVIEGIGLGNPDSPDSPDNPSGELDISHGYFSRDIYSFLWYDKPW